MASASSLPDQFSSLSMGEDEDEVSCDSCKLKALKSCLVCDASYCHTHLKPHQTRAELKRHKLIDPVKNPMENLKRRRQETTQYEVDVTLDPDTAHPDLILSEDGKQVSHGNVRKRKKLPDNTERFSTGPCVLGKQGFSSGRFYYEVQVGGKRDWSVGVARESINRKGYISLSPNYGYWTIGLRNVNEYSAADDRSVRLPVRVLQKVGVFVDYEEGLVSFYDVETRVHLYSFTGCSFTEKLFPFFNTCRNDGGRNSAPLIISPVKHTD